MADPLFLRLFDNSMEIASPADSKYMRDDSLCESPTVKSLKTNPFLGKHRDLACSLNLHGNTEPCSPESEDTGHSPGETHDHPQVVGRHSHVQPKRKPARAGLTASSAYRRGNGTKLTSEQFPRRVAVPGYLTASPSLIKPARMLLTSTPVKRPKMKLSFPLFPFVTKDTTSNEGDGSFYNTEKPYWIVGPVVSMVQYPRLEVDSPVAGPVHDQAASNVTPKESNSQWKSSPHFGGPFSLGSSPMKTHIDAAVARADSNPDLIGDGTFTFCLPTVPGKHQDLKSITSETLTKVINHEYDHILEKYVIIDCRYPYEYDGGHIQGSENVYTRDALIERFIKGAALSKTEGRRKVLIFHCEFSTERAPKLLRYLRNQDREHNVTRYPSLYYPEVYVLLDGYKAFFYSHKELCTPQSYQPMNDELFEEELWKFRNEAKHWSGDKNKRGLIKTRLSALKAVYTC